jgi:O-antigen/teichoic acid export membrane protein
MKELFKKLKQLGKEGLFHIFGSSILAKVGGILSSVIVIRNLPKDIYGAYVDAENLYAYAAVFIGLGIASAMIQYCCENITEERRAAIYRYSLKFGMLGNLILLPVIFGFALGKYFSGDQLQGQYLAMLSFLPFFAYFDQYLQLVLRVKRLNALFSRTNMLYTVSYIVGNIILTRFFGVAGLIWSQYVAHLVATLHSAYVLRNKDFFHAIRNTREVLDASYRKNYLSYSLICAITNFTSTALVLLDVTCLSFLQDSTELLADYKVAATVPMALAFVPKSLATFYYPKLVQAFSTSKREGVKSLKQMAKISGIINGCIFLGLFVCAPLILWILYGTKYMNVVPIFRILSVNYLLDAVRNITGNTIAVLKKVKANLVFSAVSGVLKVGINVLLISSMGSVGASISTVVITFCVVAMNSIYLWRQLRKG